MSEAWAISAQTQNEGSTRALAGALAAATRPGDLILLIGGLGAGKTTFAQGFAAALGVEGPVTSPTFVLVRHYPCARPGPVRLLVHADLYRLDHLVEVVDLALPELLAEGAVALVEWGDAGAPVLGESALEVSVAPGADGPCVRSITLAGRGPAWVGRRDEVESSLERLAPLWKPGHR